MKKEKILIIEDEYSIRTNLFELLTNYGYQVYTTADGREGISLAEEIKPSLIICDIMMPGVDGYNVIEQINNSNSSGIPFIFLTSKSNPEDFRKGMTLGADDYITKPYKASELINAVETRLDKYRKLNKTAKNNTVSNKQKNIEDKILLKYNNTTHIISFNSINCIIAEGEYSNVYSDFKKPVLVRRVLKDWEKILPDSAFLRIHRSYLVNINKINSIEKGCKGNFFIKIQNYPETLISSRRYLSRIKERLSA